MYIKIQEVLNLQKEIQTCLDGDKRSHTPAVHGENRIMLLYACDLLYKLEHMLEKGQYKKDRLLTALDNQDWMEYSFSSKSLWTDKALRKRLQIRPSKKILITDMLKMQAGYLEQASDYIVARLG